MNEFLKIQKMEQKQEKADEEIIEERKKKIKEILFGKNFWVVIAVIIALIFGAYIRIQPMLDHGGKPGLWDIAANSWTLGPDLDPFLFLRYAKEMIGGKFESIDMMRSVPLGFDNSMELQMVSYMIVLTYKFLNLFGSYSVDFAGVIMPVFMFILTIISFFLFVKEIFARKNSGNKNLKANVIAVISTFLMIVIPVFLSRTVAGIPEKESVGFFFMFLAFYFFIKAWKSEKIRNAIVLGVLAGISTGLMGLTWGGVLYVYSTIAIASIVAFILNKFRKKETLVLVSWLALSMIVTLLFTKRFSLTGFLTSIDTGLIIFTLLAIGIHFLLWNKKLIKIKFLEESKLPRNILSIVIALLAVIVIILIFFGPSLITDKIKAINQMMFNPIVGRWMTTVAENRQPYFTEWGASFGPFIKGVPIMFWLFFAGSVLLFRKMLSNINKKDAWIMTFFYILFFSGLVFSRYAPPPALMDGEGFASRVFYYGSAFLLFASLMYYYVKYHREGNDGLEKIDYEYILLFALFVLCLFTARSAVRLIMVLGPVAPIFASYLAVESFAGFRRNKDDETKKIIFGLLTAVIVILLLFSFWTYYKQVKSEAYSFVPSYYTQQWQKAMGWVRNNTAENSVFAHWWDYGYWVQSMGNRATVTDGGNKIVYWNYLTGRFVLTGDNQKDALEFLYTHNATHLLIDSSDLGKYGAFSIIGSDINLDRFSSGPPTMISDANKIQETSTGIVRIYEGGYGLDEDIIYKDNNASVYLPSGQAAIVGIFSESAQNNGSVSFKQPEAVYYYSNNQIRLPLRYIYYNGKLIDFGNGIGGTAYIIPRVSQGSSGMQIDNLGAVMYLSPRLMRGLLAQIYILNDTFGNFKNFKLAHSEPNIITDSLNSQGANLNEFAYFDRAGILGPIKIWEIQYNGDEKVNPDYLDTDYTKYISWQL